jgi:hypothetical protein
MTAQVFGTSIICPLHAKSSVSSYTVDVIVAYDTVLPDLA